MSTTFLERLDELISAAGSAGELARRAGLSQNYIGTLKTRIRKDATARPDETAMEALARAGGVSFEWLRKGTGDRAPAAHETPQAPAPSDEPFADAIAAAFNGKRHTLADLDAARRVARETFTHLREGADTEAIAATWLDAASSLRRAGKETSPNAILMRLSELAARNGSARDQVANDEADAALRARGMEPGAAATSLEDLKNRANKQK